MHLSQLLDDDLLTRGQGRFEMGLRDKELNVPEFPDGIPDPSNRSATAQYIGRMTGELRSLAQKADLPFLAYLLAMAEEDALSGSRKR